MRDSHRWTDVNYSDVGSLSVEKNSSNDSIKLSLMVSPLDVPVAWRHFEEAGKVVLEFKYLSTTEPFVNKSIEENILFVLGKNSKRIHKIIVNVAGFIAGGAKKGSVSFELSDAGQMATDATSHMDNKGAVKKPNARAIMNVLEHEQFLTNTAAG